MSRKRRKKNKVFTKSKNNNYSNNYYNIKESNFNDIKLIAFKVFGSTYYTSDKSR
jgi:hypothetical protein